MTVDRRGFVLGLAALPLMGRAGQSETPARTLAPWTPGMLDIHHLATGRGSATFVRLPDGSSLLIDAGATSGGPDVSAAARPDASRRPGEWIARYVQRQLGDSAAAAGLDYLLVSHLHPDHLGDVDDSMPMSAHGAYRLTGVMDVAEAMPIGTLIDRAYPDYADPAVLHAPFADNYRAFVKTRVESGLRVERFVVGRDDQLRGLGRHAVSTPFGIRNLAANGIVWTGRGDATRAMFPPLNQLADDDLPNENLCSIAIRIDSGPFRYFTGGDLTSYSFDGDAPWRDVLTAASRVAGPVDVATADHHGMFDGLSADSVRALRPQAWVIPTWHLSHPDMLQLERMLSTRLYPGPRDVFATNVMAANVLMNQRLLRRLRSIDGHVVVRVAPGGASFTIAVTDNVDEQERIKRVTGPYAVASKPG